MKEMSKLDVALVILGIVFILAGLFPTEAYAGCGFMNPPYCRPGDGIEIADWCQGSFQCGMQCKDWWKGICYVRMIYCPPHIIAFHYRCDPGECC